MESDDLVAYFCRYNASYLRSPGYLRATGLPDLSGMITPRQTDRIKASRQAFRSWREIFRPWRRVQLLTQYGPWTMPSWMLIAATASPRRILRPSPAVATFQRGVPRTPSRQGFGQRMQLTWLENESDPISTASTRGEYRTGLHAPGDRLQKRSN